MGEMGTFGRRGETEAQRGGQGGLTAPWFPPAARTPGGERGTVITFRPLMSRPELASPLGLPGTGRGGVEGSQERGEPEPRKGGSRERQPGGFWDEVGE